MFYLFIHFYGNVLSHMIRLALAKLDGLESCSLSSLGVAVDKCGPLEPCRQPVMGGKIDKANWKIIFVYFCSTFCFCHFKDEFL